MLRIAVLVSGGGTNLQALIDAIDSGKIRGAEIVRVISSKKDAYALERAGKAGIEAVTLGPEEDSLLNALEEADPGLVVLAGFLKILPKRVVERYENRMINIHPSLIPSFCGPGYYGLKVHEEVLKRGVKVTGATVHFVDEGCDSGPIILQKAVYLKKGDTPEVLQKRVMEEAEWQILPEAVSLIAEGRVSVRKGIVEINDLGQE